MGSSQRFPAYRVLCQEKEFSDKIVIGRITKYYTCETLIPCEMRHECNL